MESFDGENVLFLHLHHHSNWRSEKLQLSKKKWELAVGPQFFIQHSQSISLGKYSTNILYIIFVVVVVAVLSLKIDGTREKSEGNCAILLFSIYRLFWLLSCREYEFLVLLRYNFNTVAPFFLRAFSCCWYAFHSCAFFRVLLLLLLLLLLLFRWLFHRTVAGICSVFSIMLYIGRT